LFEAHSRPILTYALRRVSEPADAADVVADTFLVAWRRIDDVPVGDEARPWLYGVARRMLANRHRGDQRRRRLANRLRDELAAMPHLADPDRTETAATVRQALSALSDDDRELLRLTGWEGLSPTDVAIAMSMPAATVRSRLHRARKRLRAELELLGWYGERGAPDGHVADDGRAPVRRMEAR
jgi:RNA polymerase sigma-70 factor (ECF subfamily)